MSWQCGQCGAVEGEDEVTVDAVCHHCGKPLCREHQSLIADDAFGDEETPVGRKAFHCRECERGHHSGPIGKLG